MIHLWTITGNTLKLNTSEILKYKELAIIYKRDDSDDKAFAHKEFRYIDFLSNREGYCIVNGLSKKDAHNHAVLNSNLHKDYKPDTFVKIAISKVYDELNGGVIEKLIDSSIRSMSISASAVVQITDKAEDIIEKASGTDEDIAKLIGLITQITNISASIPDKVRKLLDLRKEYDIASKGTIIERGGKAYTDSLDGNGEIESDSFDEDDRMED